MAITLLNIDGFSKFKTIIKRACRFIERVPKYCLDDESPGHASGNGGGDGGGSRRKSRWGNSGGGGEGPGPAPSNPPPVHMSVPPPVNIPPPNVLGIHC